MSLRALVYAYVLGGLTLVPLLVVAAVALAVYTAVPVPDPKPPRPTPHPADTHDTPQTRRGWLTVRRAFEEATSDASYVTLVRSYLDARSKDPRRSRPKDTWYVVLKGKVLYLYEDEAMSECEAAVELGSHDVVIYPEGLLDGELFTRRHAICLKPRSTDDTATTDEPWFIFVRACVDMEDWYLALVHASDHPPGTPTLSPLTPVFVPAEMNCLVTTLDEQPDVIPMRWFNALLGRLFYAFYKTQALESYIIGRLMKKLAKVKRPTFLTDIAVTQFSVGDKAPTFSKPMLKELTKEGDASLEVGLAYKGEIRATVEATAVINLGARFKSYTVKLVLAVVLRELEGNLLVKVKRPPSSRIWYAFTKPPRMVVNVEPIVSDRQITWSMILHTIEAKIEEIITDSVVLPNMDDISFFDSMGYAHRGGIWADAVRSDMPLSTPKHASPSDQPSEDAGSSTLHSETDPSVVMDTITASSEKASTTTRRRSWFYADIEHDGEHANELEHGKKGRNTEPDSSLVDTTPSPDGPDNEQDAHEYLAPRSPSAHSRSSRAHSLSSSVGGDESIHYLSDTSATSKSPRHSFGTSTTASFLSTLKSKAGDKHALSNTAKEAMRKWGVNWGLKKENGGNADDLADAGPSYRRPQIEGAHDHQSNVDMRPAVVERGEREHGEKVNASTSPMSIPQRNGGEGGGRMSSHSTPPGLSRSLGDVSSDRFKDRDLAEVAEDNPAPSLIHTQPSQARTMTIPGIHASHRGEVMSMGNVAPTLPAPENKPKGPTIQSMYRLWKSPTLTGQPSQEAQPAPEHGDANLDVAPLSLTPEVVSPPRAVPPPLPPRTISTVVVGHATESAHESVVVPSISAASQALKSIATRDETRRLSVEVDGEPPWPMGASEVTVIPSTRLDGKPPLPPRRNPT